jgi:hypothetical protein
MASDDPLGLGRKVRLLRLLRLGAAAEAWFEASAAPEEVWSLDDVQAAWERLMDVMLEDVRHALH